MADITSAYEAKTGALSGKGIHRAVVRLSVLDTVNTDITLSYRVKVGATDWYTNGGWANRPKNDGLAAVEQVLEFYGDDSEAYTIEVESDNPADTGVTVAVEGPTLLLPMNAPGSENGLPKCDANGRVKADVEAMGNDSEALLRLLAHYSGFIRGTVSEGDVYLDVASPSVEFDDGDYTGDDLVDYTKDEFYRDRTMVLYGGGLPGPITAIITESDVHSGYWEFAVTIPARSSVNNYVGIAFNFVILPDFAATSKLVDSAPQDVDDAVDGSATGQKIDGLPTHSGTGRLLVLSQPQPGISGDTHFLFELLDAEADGKILDYRDSEVLEETQEDDWIKTVTQYTTATIGTQRQWTTNILSHDPAYTELIGDPPITLSSSDELVATIDASGADHYVGDGDYKIIAESEAIGTSPAQRFESRGITNSNSGGETTTQTTYPPHSGSVRESTTGAIDNRIVVAGKGKNAYSTQDHSTPQYIRNTDCWAADLDLTCVSPWNSRGTSKRAGVLISPRHILCARHYPLSVGDTIRFVDGSNNVVTQTIADQVKLDLDIVMPPRPDFQICLLDSDVTTCSFVKVLPSDWEDYIPPHAGCRGNKIPVLVLDQEEKALVSEVYVISDSGVATQYPTTDDRLAFFEWMISGDSGNPMFLIVNDEPVLLTVLTGGGTGTGTSVMGSYRAEIEAAMISLGGGYSTLTEIDLSGYNTY